MTSQSHGHDSITIYLHEPLSAGFEDELKQIVAPHVRGNDLIGRKIADGIYAQATPQPQEIQDLIARAEALHPELGKVVKEQAHPFDVKTATYATEAKLSAGQKYAIDAALDSFEQHKSHQLQPIAPSLSSGAAGGTGASTPDSTKAAPAPAESKRWSAACKWAIAGGIAAAAGGWVLYEKSRQEPQTPDKDTPAAQNQLR